MVREGQPYPKLVVKDLSRIECEALTIEKDRSEVKCLWCGVGVAERLFAEGLFNQFPKWQSFSGAAALELSSCTVIRCMNHHALWGMRSNEQCHAIAEKVRTRLPLPCH
ncbi:hypothetical protein NDU88_003703 [Pleurodeles waltl]|uniref:Uncharacterized protein n=1 Tax=Pleurodeles waltl TaxID=8319 RepID=A0AAV7SGP0_PLEWA|nr:hypothetical protein NDU88_003703 [Pleurodeles waltl]